MPIELHVFSEVQQLALAAADTVASELSWAAQRNGRASLAVSGGSTPWLMLEALSRHPLDWSLVHVFQVDERDAADGDDQRNLTHIRASLLDHVDIPADNVHPIPIGPDLEATARVYAASLAEHAASGLDVVHLGLGDDGHTASLVPGDPVLDVTDRAVAVTEPYRGCRRVTMTYPTLLAARCAVWLVNGAAKAEPLRRLRAQDPSIPAGRVVHDRAFAFCDDAAVSGADAEG